MKTTVVVTQTVVADTVPYDTAEGGSRWLPLKEINTAINLWGSRYRKNLPIGSGALARMKRRTRFSSFSSSFFNPITTATAVDAAPADDTEAPAKDGYEEEAAGGIEGVDGFFDTLAVVVDGGVVGRCLSR